MGLHAQRGSMRPLLPPGWEASAHPRLVGGEDQAGKPQALGLWRTSETAGEAASPSSGGGASVKADRWVNRTGAWQGTRGPEPRSTCRCPRVGADSGMSTMPSLSVDGEASVRRTGACERREEGHCRSQCLGCWCPPGPPRLFPKTQTDRPRLHYAFGVLDSPPVCQHGRGPGRLRGGWPPSRGGHLQPFPCGAPQPTCPLRLPPNGAFIGPGTTRPPTTASRPPSAVAATLLL